MTVENGFLGKKTGIFVFSRGIPFASESRDHQQFHSAAIAAIATTHKTKIVELNRVMFVMLYTIETSEYENRTVLCKLTHEPDLVFVWKIP